MTSKVRYTALLDSNVLFSAAMRDIMMEVALAKLFQPKWTVDIHYEWIDALLRNRSHLKRGKLERTRALMEKAIPTALVTGYDHLIKALHLPDPNDRHVLAAAIVGRCDVIVTQNLKDFPVDTLAQYQIDLQHPDEFLANHLDLLPGSFCMAVRIARVGRKNPPYTIDEHLEHLARIGLDVTVSMLQQQVDLLV